MDPAIRAQHPSRANSGRWADGGSMPAAALRRNLSDGRDGKQWLIVGIRPDGSALVIEEARGQRRPERRAALLRAHLEWYVSIRTERIGETANTGGNLE